MINKLLLLSLSVLTLTGCAAGAATAGYSIKAQSADSLTAVGEQRIIDRAKQEILSELLRPGCPVPPQPAIVNEPSA